MSEGQNRTRTTKFNHKFSLSRESNLRFYLVGDISSCTAGGPIGGASLLSWMIVQTWLIQRPLHRCSSKACTSALCGCPRHLHGVLLNLRSGSVWTPHMDPGPVDRNENIWRNGVVRDRIRSRNLSICLLCVQKSNKSWDSETQKFNKGWKNCGAGNSTPKNEEFSNIYLHLLCEHWCLIYKKSWVCCRKSKWAERYALLTI